MNYYEEIKSKKSLGALRKAEKTKPRSPDLVGRITLQRSLLEILTRQIQRINDDELTACIAGWKHYDDGGAFISIELSPYYASRKPNKKSDDDPFSIFDEDEPSQ